MLAGGGAGRRKESIGCCEAWGRPWRVMAGAWMEGGDTLLHGLGQERFFGSEILGANSFS